MAQRKWTAAHRLKKKQLKQEGVSANVSVPSSTTKVDLRKKEGKKTRRSKTQKLKNEIEQLRATVRQLTNENGKLKVSQSETPPRPSPSPIFLDNISPSAKRRAITRLKDAKDTLAHGTQKDIRTELGVNLSNPSAPKKTAPSFIQTTIENFLCQDHISKLCPEKNKIIDNKQVRYCLNHLSTLHEIFEYETGVEIDYVTFTR
ncbi:unnamed protein product [Didymodactylos carnosus]|uniref:Uncharacterized protein n=1 Tax=Didymodactylos carnosus TaxID=1234261 RepID=A0A813YGN9_9BILA|nr:unnamed protein product [Didymodactylos carnosus]CAF3669522.1 unnamed protein product [Didymodactylos carnosus]